MLEKDIEKKVRDYARKQGILTYKFTSPAHASVPDRIFIYPQGDIIFIEFKAPGKVATEKQAREINRLIRHNQSVYVIDDVSLGEYVIDSHLAPPVPT